MNDINKNRITVEQWAQIQKHLNAGMGEPDASTYGKWVYTVNVPWWQWSRGGDKQSPADLASAIKNAIAKIRVPVYIEQTSTGFTVNGFFAKEEHEACARALLDLVK